MASRPFRPEEIIAGARPVIACADDLVASANGTTDMNELVDMAFAVITPALDLTTTARRP